MENNISFTDSIKQHLDKMAAEDKAFAAKYADKSKNLNACVKYITDQARKQAVEGTAVIEDNTVFSWAVHYYQETEETLAKENGKVVKEVEPKKNKDSHVVSINQSTVSDRKKKKQKKSRYLELDLFGGAL